jgi:hypothetical protein
MTLPIDPSQHPPPGPVSDAAAQTVAKDLPSQPVVRRLSFRRKWCFRLLAMSLPLAGLVLIELGLRWASVGMDLGLVESVGDGAPAQTFRFNPWTDQAYYGATDLSGPEPRPFMLPKPEGTFRIVVVGGSTVVGFPYPSDLAFPRFLEILLSQQGLNRKFEVLNAGITAINSFSEADLVEQARDTTNSSDREASARNSEGFLHGGRRRYLPRDERDCTRSCSAVVEPPTTGRSTSSCRAI